MYSLWIYVSFSSFELLPRVELGTSSLPRMRSTTELKQQHLFLSVSGRRGSNPRPPAWKASALSTELLPHHLCTETVWVVMDSNHRRRKPADLQSAPFGHSGNHPFSNLSHRHPWRRSLLSDSNQRPRDYKSRALANWAKEAFADARMHTNTSKRLQN